MPNNRNQAVNRLNGLLRMLKKKPQMEKDYLDFMEKILSKGHASPVPQEAVWKGVVPPTLRAIPSDKTYANSSGV